MNEIKTRVDKVVHYGAPFFQGLLHDIEFAKSRVYLEYYIFEDDEVGRQVADAAIRAKKRGIDVRVMVDGIGSPAFSYNTMSRLAAGGVESKVYHPLPWDFPLYIEKGFRYFLYRFLAGFYKMNNRNHRKLCLVDGEKAWLGSHNITSKILGPPPWRETGLRLIGPEVSVLEDAFLYSWDDRAPKPRKDIKNFKNLRVRLNNYFSIRRMVFKDLIRRIIVADDRVWITSAYFTPPRAILLALRFARTKNVDVQIIVPKHSDVYSARIMGKALYRQLLNSGVRVFEFMPSMIHAKSLIIDDWFLIGSSNLNHRSLFHDLEVDVTLTEEETQISLEDQFKLDIGNSREVTLQEVNHQPLFERILAKFLVFLRYWF